MASRAGKTRSLPGQGVFELHRLDWTAPDRLEVTGEFKDLAASPADAPVLVVHGAGGTHRLPAVAESLSGAPEQGRPWRAEFVWEVPPIPFDTAALEFGDAIHVELGAPNGRDDGAGENGAAQAPNGTERLHLQSEMLVAEAAAREASAEAERLRTALARATEDLESERARHAAAGDRFREGLAAVEGSAQEALEAERSAAQQLGSDLQKAQEDIAERDAELERVNGELLALRERVGDLERSSGEAAQTRVDLEQAMAEAQQAREESERLSGRIARIREALDDAV